MMERTGRLSFCLQVLIILACFATSIAVESDISCLRSIKESLEDPLQIFSTWNFNKSTQGFICGFTGVECWNPEDNRVLKIELPGMRLKGTFPIGIINCNSLQVLDLSGNHLSGPIPSDLSNDLAYMVDLNLSDNNFSGPIPPSIANFTFLNVLRLDKNSLTGQIPPEFATLRRMTIFSVANNRLSGPVPIFSNTNFSAESYAYNLGLCGGPLKACNDEGHDTYFFYSGFAVGFSLSTLISMLFVFLCWSRLRTRTMSYYHLLIKKLLERRKHYLIPTSPQILFAENVSSMETKVTAMEKYIRRLSLREIEMATNDFDDKNVIGYGNMGVMYKALFPDRLLVAVKRLHRFENFEKEFLSTMEILGRLRHKNLVPLLGFCFETEKKFLVYKYMCNGTLHNWLHCRPQEEVIKMGWNLRLKIAVGVAEGLAWLHYNNVLWVAHLKINSKCILLDDKFEPNISNFGNAKILMNESGTPLSVCKFVVPDSSLYKEDVYRFGILLLELVTGKEPTTWINSMADYVCGMDFDLIDECIMGQGFDEEIYEILEIAENCIHPRGDEATSMLQVYQAMRSIGILRNEISVNSFMDVENN
ncbi:hypothetical protein L2E82_21554 [Cichorium intybus]|uniref:Uncharacterized protein n=1 Tax=Cichorium intybus TaxID=13427 RepID=A0ACB9DVK3_CICIN|nr:hypothetical protein L2E82_21554 [Cichorium intybus]